MPWVRDLLQRFYRLQNLRIKRVKDSNVSVSIPRFSTQARHSYTLLTSSIDFFLFLLFDQISFRTIIIQDNTSFFVQHFLKSQPIGSFLDFDPWFDRPDLWNHHQRYLPLFIFASWRILAFSWALVACWVWDGYRWWCHKMGASLKRLWQHQKSFGRWI